MTNLTKSFAITPAKVTVKWSGDTGTSDYSKAIVYDATNHTMTATVCGINGVVLKTFVVTGKDAGVYTIVINEIGNDNYTTVGVSNSDLERTMWIVPYSASTFEITNANYNDETNTNQIIYTGEPITLNVIIKDHRIGDTVSATVLEVKKYDQASNSWVSIDASQVKEVGQYRVWIRECNNANYVTYSEGTFMTFEIVNAQ
jgi:hypothetical protein